MHVLGQTAMSEPGGRDRGWRFWWGHGGESWMTFREFWEGGLARRGQKKRLDRNAGDRRVYQTEK
jgi:hypothetical protein